MIKIRKHLKEDIPFRVEWFNNANVIKFIGDEMGQKTTLKKEKEWFKNYNKAKNKKFFTICDNSKPIGLMGLNVSKYNKNADLFIAIGEDEYRGKGIGKIAMRWLIDYGFRKLGLHKINLGVIQDNIPAVKLYQSLGFIIEGKMKEEIYYKGKFHDFLLMAIFNKNRKKYGKQNQKNNQRAAENREAEGKADAIRCGKALQFGIIGDSFAVGKKGGECRGIVQ